MNRNLVFDAKKHEYSVGGVVIPSVTQIIRFLSCDTAAAASPAMRDAAAERGSRIHEACTAFDVDGDGIDVDGDIIGYVRAYAAFLRDYRIREWILFEAPLLSVSVTNLYAGTIDRYGIIDGLPTLVDIKTGSKINMPLHRVQLAGYTRLLRDNEYSVQATAVLHLRKDGSYTYRPQETADVIAFSVFDYCRVLHDYMRGESK